MAHLNNQPMGKQRQLQESIIQEPPNDEHIIEMEEEDTIESKAFEVEK